MTVRDRSVDSLRMPSDLMPVAALGAGFMGYLIWNQAYWWNALEENWFG